MAKFSKGQDVSVIFDGETMQGTVSQCFKNKVRVDLGEYGTQSVPIDDVSLPTSGKGSRKQSISNMSDESVQEEICTVWDALVEKPATSKQKALRKRLRDLGHRGGLRVDPRG